MQLKKVHMIEMNRKASDRVELRYKDDDYCLAIGRTANGAWAVRRYFYGVRSKGTEISIHDSADEALAFAKRFLEEGRDELTNALDKHGFKA